MDTRKEYEEFLYNNTARFTEILGRYTKALVKAHREYFIETSVEMGWRWRDEIGKTSDIRWWENVCLETAGTRALWTIVTTTGKANIKANRLGR
jgi:hypothetical protein